MPGQMGAMQQWEEPMATDAALVPDPTSGHSGLLLLLWEPVPRIASHPYT